MKNCLTFFLPLILIVTGCIETTTSNGSEGIAFSLASPTTETPPVTNVDGDFLKSMSTLERSRRESKLIEAESDYNLNPTEENTIWYGRWLAYLGKYQNAIDIYTIGLDKFPESYRLYRHRGHRYISTRQFDLAIEDLTNAAFYSNNDPNEIEEDGIPNNMNKPLSNIKFNIWYHLGLAYYMKGNYDKAVSSFKKCEMYANNNDLSVKIGNWLYVSYRKLGNMEIAEALIADISTRMSLVETENRQYHDLIMLYRGFVTPGILVQRNTNNSILDANIGYGIGNYYMLNGQVQNAKSMFNRVLSSEQWDSFGYIASETESLKLN